METEIQTEMPASDKIILNAKKSESVVTDGPMIPKPKEGPKKRGRKPKAETEFINPKKEETKQDASETKPKFEIPTHVICYPIVKAVSVVGVNIAKDNRAAISANEAEDMARAMGMVMEKYMPDAMSKWGPELMLGLSLGQYSLRVYALAKMNHEAQMRASQSAEKARPVDDSNVSKIYSETPETVVP